MRTTPRQVRDEWGCGYLPLAERARPQIWSHEGYRGPKPTTCVGYTTKLPEVIEVARARLHWGKGSLSVFTGGEPPSEPLIIGIETLEIEQGKADSWELAEIRRKNGGH
jgi:hypothetical protein